MGLIEFWTNLKKTQNLFVHPADNIDINKNYKDKYSYDDYINNLKNLDVLKDDSKFHLSLIPIPYIGDIINAKIYILMLNPGFERLDYYAESKDNELKASLFNNLYQENLDPEYPFIFLNPKFLWHGGGRYYENRFKWLIEKAQGDTYNKKLSQVAQKVAVLQYYPYHSKNKPKQPLNSSKEIFNFVENELMPKAKKEEICIIRVWGWSDLENDNVIDSDNTSCPYISRYINQKNYGKHWERIIANLNDP